MPPVVKRAAPKRSRKPAAAPAPVSPRVAIEERRYEMALAEQRRQLEGLNEIDRALGAQLKSIADDMAARAGGEQFGLGAFQGAKDLSTSGRWNPPSASADEEMADDLPKLRRRSADLVRNNVWASTLVNSLVDQVIGTGFELQSTTRADKVAADEEFVEGWRQACEDVWARYVEEADVCEQCNAHDLARQAFTSLLVRGDVFLVRRVASPFAPQREFLARWQIIEADLVRTPYDETDGTDLRFGVKLGRFGRPIGYFVHDEFENGFRFSDRDRANSYRFVRRIDPQTGLLNVLHLMQGDRPAQTRGLPWLSPVIPTVDNLGQFNDAALLRQKLAASITGFIKRNRRVAQSMRSDDAETPVAKIKLAPGRFNLLDEGTTVDIPELKVPTDDYGAFLLANLKGVCASRGFPLIWALKDYAEANYSNLRGAAMDARVLIENKQALVGRGMYRPWYETAVEEAWLDGRMGRYSREVELLDARGNRTRQWSEWMRVRTQGPVRGIIDLDKEIAAYALAIEKGMLTEADVHLLLTGRDVRDAKEQFARERDDDAKRRLPNQKVRARLETYGVAKSAGAITPQPEDEEAFRQDLGLPKLVAPAPTPSVMPAAVPAAGAPTEEVIRQ